MEDGLIDRIVSRYAKLSVGIIVAVALLEIVLLSGSAYWNKQSFNIILLSVFFSLVAMAANAYTWSSTAKNSPHSLTRLYLVSPIVRMFAAIAVMFGYYAIHKGDTFPDGSSALRTSMLSFTGLFFTFYIVLMIFDCVYFAKVEKRNKI